MMADCPSCGAPLEAHARFCPHCGNPAPAGEHPETPPADDETTLVTPPDHTTPTLELDDEGSAAPADAGTVASGADVADEPTAVMVPTSQHPDAASDASADEPAGPAPDAFPGVQAAAEETPGDGADIPDDGAETPGVAHETGATSAEETVALPPDELPDAAADTPAAGGSGEKQTAILSSPGAEEQTVVLPAGGSGEEQTVVLPASGAAAGAWPCPGCGAQGAGDDLFCGRCGTPRPPDVPAVCAACGASLDEDMAFCPRCGARRGDIDSAAGRQETMVLPATAAGAAAGGPAGVSQPPSAPPPVDRPPAAAPPPPPAPTGKPRRRGARWAVLAVVVVVLGAIAAGVYFGFFYQRGGPEDAIVPIEPLIDAIVPDQSAANDALESLAPDEESFATLAENAGTLRESIERAANDADAIVVDDPQAVEILKAFERALDAHLDYATALDDLPADPTDLTVAEADIAATRAKSAQAAYEDLAALTPALPKMPFPVAATDNLAAVAAEVEQQAGELAALQTFLSDIEALFPDSRAERLAAEDILAQLEATEIPPDNAGGQMAAQAVRLRGVAARIDAIAAPDDQRAEQIQATYREAVGHWVTAARQYARWMAHLWEYYQASGDWPPEYGIEADTYLDPAYDAARQATDLATAAREQLAEEVNSLTQTLGGSAEFTADDM
jgi:hypothetical protein